MSFISQTYTLRSGVATFAGQVYSAGTVQCNTATVQLPDYCQCLFIGMGLHIDRPRLRVSWGLHVESTGSVKEAECFDVRAEIVCLDLIMRKAGLLAGQVFK